MKAAGAALVLVFMTTSCNLCFCTGTMFTIFNFFFGFPRGLFSNLPKRKKKKQQQRGWSLSSNGEMNILSLCNPLLSHLHRILELNGIVEPQCD